jgi:hypothetical protein
LVLSKTLTQRTPLFEFGFKFENILVILMNSHVHS